MTPSVGANSRLAIWSGRDLNNISIKHKHMPLKGGKAQDKSCVIGIIMLKMKSNNKKGTAFALLIVLLVSSISGEVFAVPTIMAKISKAAEIEATTEETSEVTFEEVTEEEAVEATGEEEVIEEVTEDEVVEEESDFEEIGESEEEDALGTTWNGRVAWHLQHYLHKYDGLKKGDPIKVWLPKPEGDEVYIMGETYSYQDPWRYPSIGSYVESEDAWYGIMLTPDYDTEKFEDLTCLVKIPGVKAIEDGKVYDAEYLMNIPAVIGFGDYANVYGIQVVNDRIYLMPRWNISKSYKNEKGETVINNCYVYLLYSVDLNAEDMKLHVRYLVWSYDNANTDILGYFNDSYFRGFKYDNGKWCVWCFKDAMPENIQYIVKPLSDLGIPFSQEGLTGFLAPGGEYFEIEDRYSVNNDIAEYVNKWSVDNGFRKSYDIAPKDVDNSEITDSKPDELTDQNNGKTVSSDKILAPKETFDAKAAIGMSGGKMKFTSSNKKVASVKKSGIVTAKGDGTTTITGYYKDGKQWVKAGSVEVKVSKPYLSSKTITVKQGSVVDIDKYLTNGSSMKPTFTCSGSALSMTKDGTISADAPGKSKIIIAFGKFKLKLKVTVTP